MLKKVGLAEPLRDALKPLSSAIRAAFVYGSVAKAADQSASDIDLMIISDSLTYGEVFGALERAASRVGRQITDESVARCGRSPEASTVTLYGNILRQWVSIGGADTSSSRGKATIRRAMCTSIETASWS